MLRQIFVSLRMMLLLLLVLGLAFPLAVTEIAQAAFSRQANGSLVYVNGKPVGSALIGQTFTQDKYFWPRPSSAGNGYDPNASSASNLGPTSKTLMDNVKALVATDTLKDPGLQRGQVPVDMVTGSGSGLDPDVSVANALAQVTRVAKARGLSVDSVRSLVESHVQGRTFGLFGDPRVNVLELNIALDGQAAKQR
jgi:K+-transporting ATPase ATPase C chain